MNNLKMFLSDNKAITILYILGTFLFYTLIFIFYRNSIDAPVDLILIMFYNIFIPGIFFFALFYRYFDKTLYNENIIKSWLISIVFSLLIPVIFSLTYLLLIQYFQSFHYLLLHFISLPMIFLSTIITLEIKTQFEHIIFKIGGVLIYLVTYYILNILIKYDMSNISLYINILYFFIAPIIIIIILYKKLLLVT